MSKVIVRYKVKPGLGEENTTLVKAVFAELKKSKPDGVRYAAVVGEDGVTFFHIVSFDDGVDNPLPKLDAFKAFQKGLADRCDEKPVVAQVTEVDSFNFFD